MKMSHVLTRGGGVCALVVIPLVLASCGGPNNPQPNNPKKTIPVHGEVYIDGKPGKDVLVHLTPKGGVGAEVTEVSVGQAGDDGKFNIRTYGTDDGAPAGEYTLTFEWIDRSNPIQFHKKAPVDKLGGKYADTKTSKHSVTVPADATDVEIPRIDLTNK